MDDASLLSAVLEHIGPYAFVAVVLAVLLREQLQRLGSVVVDALLTLVNGQREERGRALKTQVEDFQLQRRELHVLLREAHEALEAAREEQARARETAARFEAEVEALRAEVGRLRGIIDRAGLAPAE